MSTDSPSTSATSELSCLQHDRAALIHQALTEASVNRAQRQAKVSKNIRVPGLRIANKDKSNSSHAATEEQKSRIRTHPLASVVMLLMEKLESATCKLNPAVFQIDNLRDLLEKLSSEGKPMLTGDSETDDLMINVVLDLRTQLAELERVAKLAEQFTQKYNAVIRKVVSHESLIGPNTDSDDDLSDSEGRVGILNDNGIPHSSALFSNGALATLTTPNGIFSIPLPVSVANHSIENEAEEGQNPATFSYPFPHALFAHFTQFMQQQNRRLSIEMNQNSENVSNHTADTNDKKTLNENGDNNCDTD